jgi:hypothetical protein
MESRLGQHARERAQDPRSGFAEDEDSTAGFLMIVE